MDDDLRRDADLDEPAAVGIGAAHERFGGLDLPAGLAGMLAALGLTVLLAGIVAAAGSVGYQRGASSSALSTGGLVAGFLVLLVAFLVGGWVAGRMARYDGLPNGLLAAVLFLVLAAVVSGLGAWLGTRYDFFAQVRLPQWFSGPSTTGTVVSAVVGMLVMLVAAALGGLVGARYHRRADAVVAAARRGGPRHTRAGAVRVERSQAVETDPAP